jgi:uncharacterized membrane protein
VLLFGGFLARAVADRVSLKRRVVLMFLHRMLIGVPVV